MTIPEKREPGQSPPGSSGLRGALCTTAKAAAIAYAIEGISVIPLAGKKPTVYWKPYQQRRADVMEIHRWNMNRLLHNVGIVCGAVSGNLVVIDLDGDQAVALYERTFPALLETFTVRTGSGHGKHIYYYVDDLPPTTRIMDSAGANFELRANGCYVVAPPSIHPDTGQQYRVLLECPILRLPDMEAVKRWLYALKQPQTAHPGKKRSMTSGWAARALGYEARDVRLAKEGTRNNRLYLAAYNLGQIVGDGLLSRSDVESALLGAATAAGLPENEALRTITSGLDTGIANPRSEQWKRRTTT